MKAILVIEMPNSCDECPCCTWIPEYSEYGCGISGNLEDITDKPSWCPLKTLPKKMTPVVLHQCVEDEFLYQKGWNDCLEEITDESNTCG